MPDVKSDHLLDRARGSLPRSPGAPRQADLRRGVSDAYYALFHHLTDAVARQALRNCSSVVMQRYRRTLSHAGLKDVSQQIAAPGAKLTPLSLAVEAKRDQDVRSVAQALVDLQQERHLADYEHDAVFDVRRLTDAVATAGQAVSMVDRLRNHPPMCAYLTCLALRSSWSWGQTLTR